MISRQTEFGSSVCAFLEKNKVFLAASIPDPVGGFFFPLLIVPDGEVTKGIMFQILRAVALQRIFSLIKECTLKAFTLPSATKQASKQPFTPDCFLYSVSCLLQRGNLR